MKQLLGFIERRGGYYNFMPQYVYGKDGGGLPVIEAIPAETRFKEYPKYGTINLWHNNKPYSEARRFLEEMYDEYSILSLEIEEQELQDNVHDTVLKRVNLQEMVDGKLDLKDRIKRISDLNIFKVVTIAKQPYTQLANPKPILVEGNVKFDELVVVEHGGKFIGPYRIINKNDITITKDERDLCVVKSFESGSPGVKEFVFTRETGFVKSLVQIRVVFVPDTCPRSDMDIITEDILLEKMSKAYGETDFQTLYRDSPFLSRRVPEDIRNKRYETLENIFNNIKKDNKEKIELAKIILDNLSDRGQEEQLSAIVESRIISHPKYKNMEAARDKALSEAEELLDKLKKAENEIGELKTQIPQQAQNGKPPITQEEVTGLEKRAEELKTAISGLEERYGNYEKMEELETEIKNMAGQRDTLETGIKELKDSVGTIINGITPSRVAFEPVVTNEILKAAGRYQKEEEAINYKKRSELAGELCKGVPAKPKQKLVDYLVERVQRERPTYSHNEIINIYTCIVQGFLTIFSGKPGTGKTSMCNIIADSLGLRPKTPNAEDSRFVSISVERGWASKRDLIGYYNPLTRRYDKSNMGIYDALMTLTHEREKSKLPYVILLDEANLSPIEYYWSIFMAATEIDKSGSKPVWIDIGTEERIYIPETLKFIATINNDQTTEPLSPRLIDRAWVIKLPVPTDYEGKTQEGKNGNDAEDERILWRDLKTAFSNDNKTVRLSKPLSEIYTLFNDHQMEISPRIINVISSYISAAQGLMKTESQEKSGKTQEADQAALDFAVAQKLLTKINGFYDTYEKLFDKLSRICDDNNLVRVESAINKMTENKDNNMGYCQFLV
jgi:MoxR-like ATPase